MSSGAGAKTERGPGVIVGVLALAGVVVSLMQTMIIPLVPKLPSLLGSTASETAWAVTATLLAAAVATPTMGRLGDMYGKRRLLLVSLLLLIAGSVVAALSEDLALLVVGRVLQGLAAAVIPLGISIMRDALPRERLGPATAMMSASLGIGGALGLPASALLAEKADWHLLFWTSAGLGVLVLALVQALVPESGVRAGGRFDLLGAAGLSAVLVALLLAVSKGSTWGWASGLTLGLLSGAVVVALVWGKWELRAPHPLVDLRTTARRQVLLTNIASAVFGFALFAMSLVLPQLLQLPAASGYGLGQSLLVVGLVMAPNGLVMMAVAPSSARISAARGPKVTLMLGALVVALGYGLGLFMMATVWQLVLVSCVIGAGIGLAYGAMPALVMGAVPISETAAANSLNTLMRSIGTSVSSAVTGVVLAQMVIGAGTAKFPSQGAFRLILGIGAAAALIALAVAAFIPGLQRSPATGEERASATPAFPAPGTTEPPTHSAAVTSTPGRSDRPQHR
ncbi:MFS transporter [Amycolatopsis sp. PS_44_ISF1]|uniref:MFS transporter n=1 Tax=Amycolatopsis sp. PS_44_ISF1 TaxID=2974917 RepID=UPI0028DE322A|nr:MFS transporter [Amycolatopsis sp. PS_44_ISF1]MDT8912363.1 MFS transporter [Amycolatopsis sp. PS_44_ISF1]